MTSENYLQFINLYTKHQKKIYLFILSMVHRQSDAEDIMQQTAMEMWQMFDRYDEKASFPGWGIGIARYRVLIFRKQQNKQNLFLTDELYERIIDELQQSSASSPERAEALNHCLKRLKDSDQALLDLHYKQGLNYRLIAEKFRLSKSGIYKVMTRIHLSLQKCVERTMLTWETGL